jgi:hypothetical protein
MRSIRIVALMRVIQICLLDFASNKAHKWSEKNSAFGQIANAHRSIDDMRFRNIPDRPRYIRKKFEWWVSGSAQ